MEIELLKTAEKIGGIRVAGHSDLPQTAASMRRESANELSLSGRRGAHEQAHPIEADTTHGGAQWAEHPVKNQGRSTSPVPLSPPAIPQGESRQRDEIHL